MPLFVRKGAAVREIKKVFVRDGAAVRELKNIYVRTGGIVRKVWSPYQPDDPELAIACGPVKAQIETPALDLYLQIEYNVTPPPREVASPADVTVTGGNGNYSFAWTKLAGHASATVEDASQKNAIFKAVLRQGEISVSVWRLNVSSGNKNRSLNVTVTLKYYVPGYSYPEENYSEGDVFRALALRAP